MAEIGGDDQLTEIREVLARVRFSETPPWGIQALFTACFRLVDIAETQRVELADLRGRLIKHEMRLREGDAQQVSFLNDSKDGVLDVFK